MLDGQREALKLLRRLERLNSDEERPEESARLVRVRVLEATAWPEDQQQRFMRVIADWLTIAVMGWGTSIDEYKMTLTPAGRAKLRAERECARALVDAKYGKPSTH